MALVDGVTGEETTYSQLHTSVVKVSSALVKLGLRKGDVVTVYSPNCVQFAVATLAIAASGATFSCVNPLYTTGELKNAMSHVGARILFASQALVPLAMDAVKHCPTVKEVVVFGEADSCRSFSSLLDDDMTAFPENIDFRSKDDIVALPFSSGTTGLPKGVMLSQYNLVANITQNREETAMGYRPFDDCVLAVLPFYHIYGQLMVMFCGLFCGTKIVVLPNFQPVSFLRAIQNYHPTFLPIVPPLMLFLAKDPTVSGFDTSSVRQVTIGAAPVPLNIVHEFLARFKKTVVRQAYGLTETSPLTHMSAKNSTKYHSAGPTINNTKFKIIDMETGQLLGPGKSGELCVAGPQVMVGYLANKKATEETIVDGWLHSGDVCHYDEDGHVIVDDRIKEMIKVKGFQVAPAELEAILVGHPAVKDAAVVGIEDERLGEAPKAFVVLKPGAAKIAAEELKKYVAERVATYKRLAGGIEFRSEIPKTPSGKILRRNLRAEAEKK